MMMGEEHCGPGGCKLRIVDVSKVFEGRRGKVVALEGINLNIRGGEFVCLVGASGCGKTSLLNIIAGLEFPSSGVVELDGEPVTGPGRDRTVMFQESALFPWLDVMGNVMFGLKLTPGLTRGDRLAIAEKNLELVGLKDCSHSHIHELSGGMKQRVALARALATSPRILLMDEPFAALDAMTREQLYQDLQDIHFRCGMTIIFVTHNMREAVCLGDRVVLFTPHPGRIREEYFVSLPHPRDINNRDLAQLSARITQDLKGAMA
ncbi:ABC transporter ATP-binding protein [Akkermansia muciniphila]|uniref:ABC transporter ATP-binding protein n=1 Tax=Akkermansia muciniphila TaxID=239935 RepID=UPI0033BD3155